MSFPILPFILSPEDAQLENLSITGQVLFAYDSLKLSKHWIQQFSPHLSVFVQVGKEVSVDQITELLNLGVEKVFIRDESQYKSVVEAGLPEDRFASTLASSKSSLIVDAELDDLKKHNDDENRDIYFDFSSASAPTQDKVDELAKLGYTIIVPSSSLTTAKHESNKISISSAFVNTLVTDRPDGLFTTLITSPAPQYTALGIVYSSKESIIAAIDEKVGVYQSRKRTHELWYKGKTSGATQTLLQVSKDCDSDVVKFVVENRKGYGFCHKSTKYTCFGDDLQRDNGHGLSKLDATLQDRFENAPEGSYSKRLFNDESLLIAKLKEELDELIDAKGDKNEVAWEAADLLYFVMCWCVKNGVSLSDVEKNLDVKSLKVTRRKGDAKPAYLEKEQKKNDKKVAAQPEQKLPQNDDYQLEVIDAGDLSSPGIAKAMARPAQKTSEIMKLVLPIIENVKSNGDKALLELTAKFDGVTLDAPVLSSPFPESLMNISQEMKDAIDLSMANIEKFHAAQLPKDAVMTVETAPGVYCSRFAKPIENVGLYVPGGTAVLPSTAMMLGVPAKVAGCKNIVIASPPSRSTGQLTPEVVYVAHKLGASCIVMAGGAQAITALAYGTESVIKCDKILGPGNQFVTAAKMYVQNDTQALCSIDMPAGPSEVLVIADEDADADFVASDLLSQAEHGIDSQVILIGVGLSSSKLQEFQQAVTKQASVLPRKEIVAKCLSHSYILLAKSYKDAFDLSNQYAPEHLILQINKASSFVPDYIENAGSVFVGALSPESCGDYSSGTNHTLPTYGYARQYSGVNTATFQKFITSQDVTEQGLKSIGKAVMTLAAVEGLEAHRRAVEVRMEKLGLL
ncbi:HIS4 [Candida theae]|uniref:Histidine biosynthesis trifunctional protein n=1 Tax=Candida theae TaxID=1198502 RepID=A0AAD5BG25_9ASCO|nr:HIS4 [Candida theae]KAI5959366.1 HIS4 [Candida theae]